MSCFVTMGNLRLNQTFVCCTPPSVACLPALGFWSAESQKSLDLRAGTSFWIPITGNEVFAPAMGFWNSGACMKLAFPHFFACRTPKTPRRNTSSVAFSSSFIRSSTFTEQVLLVSQFFSVSRRLCACSVPTRPKAADAHRQRAGNRPSGRAIQLRSRIFKERSSGSAPQRAP